MRNNVVLIDVDGTIIIWATPTRSGIHRQTLRPGMANLILSLKALGFEVHVWSAGGAEYAKGACERYGLTSAVDEYHTKPDYPMTPESVVAIVGSAPALQLDDDESEFVGDWPCLLLDPFTP